MDRFPTQRDINQIKPAPENEAVYHAIAWDDPAIHELSKDIKEHGLIEPILISTDGFIISGHRRRVAAALAGLTQVPVKIHPISRAEDPQGFIKLLVVMNSQRVKSTSDLLHETLIKIDPKDAHKQIVNQRLSKNACAGLSLSLIDPAISDAATGSRRRKIHSWLRCAQFLMPSANIGL